MKILLRDVGTGQFLSGARSWTDDLEKAYDWRHSRRLLDYVNERGLVGVEIAVKFPGCDSVELYPLQTAMPVFG